MGKIKIFKTILKDECWVCGGKKCPACHNTGYWETSIFYHVFKGKDGKEYCIDGDSIK
jgi:hypothetical protein